jgi:hypothetical protein
MTLCIKCNTRKVSQKRVLDGKKICGHCASLFRQNIKRLGVSRKTGKPTHGIIECSVCKKQYKGLLRSKYCSDECRAYAKLEYSKAYNKTRKYVEARKLRRRKPEVRKTCTECSTRFYTNNTRTVCCSDDCKKSRMKKQMKAKYVSHNEES